MLLPAAFGGLESVVRELAAGVIRHGHRATVGVLEIPGGAAAEFAATLEAQGVPCRRIPVSGRGYRQERAGVREWLRHVGPHVLHTHGYRPDIVDAPVGRHLGLVTVTTFHGFCGNSLRERLYERLQVYAARRAARVVAVSRAIESRLRQSGIASGKLVFLPNAVPGEASLLSRQEARQVLGIGPDQPVVGWVGRLTREKGPDLALEAHARLIAPRPHLVMIGDGADRKRLESLSGRLGTARDVRWLGALPSANRYFKAFDVLLLSSRTEGSPMVILEAAQAGVPIVATRVGEVPEITGEDGALIVEPGQPDRIASALERAFQIPGQADDRASRARSRVASLYSVGPWTERHLQLYADAIQEGGR